MEEMEGVGVVGRIGRWVCRVCIWCWCFVRDWGRGKIAFAFAFGKLALGRVDLCCVALHSIKYT